MSIHIAHRIVLTHNMHNKVFKVNYFVIPSMLKLNKIFKTNLSVKGERSMQSEENPEYTNLSVDRTHYHFWDI